MTLMFSILIMLLSIYNIFVGAYFVRNSLTRGNFSKKTRLGVVSMYLPLIILPLIVMVGML